MSLIAGPALIADIDLGFSLPELPHLKVFQEEEVEEVTLWDVIGNITLYVIFYGAIALFFSPILIPAFFLFLIFFWPYLVAIMPWFIAYWAYEFLYYFMFEHEW